eukprot:UN28254
MIRSFLKRGMGSKRLASTFATLLAIFGHFHDKDDEIVQIHDFLSFMSMQACS